MKIYLAGGMTIMNVRGQERQVSSKFPRWRRLFSYHYLILIHKSEILLLSHESLLSSSGTSKSSKTRT